MMECILLEIRGKTIEYSARKKKNKNEAQNLAIHRLELAEIASDREPLNTYFKSELSKAKTEVEDFAKSDLEGALCRARAKWQVDGEKPSKFFCALEKFNALQKYIPELKLKNNKNQKIIVTRLIYYYVTAYRVF